MMATFCEDKIVNLLRENDVVGSFRSILILTVIGMTTSVLQRLTIFKFKDNVSLDVGHIGLEVSIVINFIILLKILGNSTE